LVLGLAPQPILSRTEKSVDAFVANYRDRLDESKRSPDAPAHVYPALAAAPTPAAPPAPAPEGNAP
jgi:hypothetical protein